MSDQELYLTVKKDPSKTKAYEPFAMVKGNKEEIQRGNIPRELQCFTTSPNDDSYKLGTRRVDGHQSKCVNLFDNRLHNDDVCPLQEEYIQKYFEQGSEQITKKQAVNELDLNSRRSSVIKTKKMLMASYDTEQEIPIHLSSDSDISLYSDNDYEDSTTEMSSTEVENTDHEENIRNYTS